MIVTFHLGKPRLVPSKPHYEFANLEQLAIYLQLLLDTAQDKVPSKESPHDRNTPI